MTLGQKPANASNYNTKLKDKNKNKEKTGKQVVQNFKPRTEPILPEGTFAEAGMVGGTEADIGIGIGAATGWGTFLPGVESSRAKGVTFNFPGDLIDFALIAYRLFWNQFQTYNKIINKLIWNESSLFKRVVK